MVFTPFRPNPPTPDVHMFEFFIYYNEKKTTRFEVNKIVQLHLCIYIYSFIRLRTIILITWHALLLYMCIIGQDTENINKYYI